MGYQGNYPPSTPLNPTQLGTGVVTTDAIANGAVIPADLSTGAPYWNTSGQVFVGNSTNLTVSGVSNSGFAVQSTGGAARILVSRLSNDISAPALFGAKSRSTTFGSFAAVASGDDLFDMRFNGDDGSTLNTYPAQVKAIVTGAVSTGVIPAALTFGTAASGNATERMRIDSSGNVGIGTASPAYKLDVSGSARVTSDVRTGNYYAYNSVGSYSGLGFYGDAALTTRYAVLETQIGTATILKTDGATPLIFGTNASERMRIDSSGNVGIGTTSTLGNSLLNVSLGVVARNSGAAVGYFQFYNDTAGTDLKTWRVGNLSSGALRFETVNDAYNSATERMRIESNGQLWVGYSSQIFTGSTYRLGISFDGSSSQGIVIKNTVNSASGAAIRFVDYLGNFSGGGIYFTSSNSISYATSSDYRLKDNVKPLKNGIETISALAPVSYTWKVDGKYGEGFIAHDLQAVIPNAVTGEKDAVNQDGSINAQGVDYSKIVVHLVAAIQELKAELDALKGTK